jgi:hypothetical protein
MTIKEKKQTEEDNKIEKSILEVQILSDLVDFDASLSSGYYEHNPDEAIKDFKRIMKKVRQKLTLI